MLPVVQGVWDNFGKSYCLERLSRAARFRLSRLNVLLRPGHFV